MRGMRERENVQPTHQRTSATVPTRLHGSTRTWLILPTPETGFRSVCPSALTARRATSSEKITATSGSYQGMLIIGAKIAMATAVDSSSPGPQQRTDSIQPQGSDAVSSASALPGPASCGGGAACFADAKAAGPLLATAASSAAPMAAAPSSDRDELLMLLLISSSEAPGAAVKDPLRGQSRGLPLCRPCAAGAGSRPHAAPGPDSCCWARLAPCGGASSSSQPCCRAFSRSVEATSSASSLKQSPSSSARPSHISQPAAPVSASVIGPGAQPFAFAMGPRMAQPACVRVQVGVQCGGGERLGRGQPRQVLLTQATPSRTRASSTHTCDGAAEHRQTCFRAHYGSLSNVAS